VLVETASGDSLVTLWVDEAHAEFSVALRDDPTGVVLDPDHWILMEAAEVPFSGMPEGPGAAGDLTFTVYPSPPGDAFSIRYAVPRSQHIRVEIYDVLGRMVCCLVDRFVGKGEHEAAWRGTDRAGNRVAPGVYLCRLSAGGDHAATRLLLIR
jgi:hypothetical protein